MQRKFTPPLRVIATMARLHHLPLLLLLLLPALTVAQSYTLPRYELAQGVARTQVDILRNKYRLDDKNSDEFGHFDQEQVRIHLLKRLSNEGQGERYSFYQFVDKTASGQPDKLVFKDGEHHRLSAEAAIEATEISVSPSSDHTGEWNDEARDYVRDYLSGNAEWNKLITLASSQPFTTKQAVQITEPLLTTLGFSEASVTLLSVQPMWQHEVAEFSLRAKIGANSCQGRAWFTLDDGRPLQHYWDCYAKVNQPDRVVQQNTLLTRGWQYSDRVISQFSPSPMPQLHPNGTITGLAYSEPLKRLLILSRSREGDENWLSYWDSRRRQAVLSHKVIGDKLASTPNSELIAIASSQGFISGELQISNRLKPFGQIKPKRFDPEHEVLAMGLLGFYPLTLSARGELELWNLGYGKKIGRYSLKDKTQRLLATAADGRVITSSKAGAVHLLTMAIDESGCDKAKLNSWCEGARLGEVSLIKAFNIPADDIASIEIHPEQPLLALTLDSMQVALFNYESAQYVLLNDSTISFDTDNDVVITDQGLYELSGQRIKSFASNPLMLIDQQRKMVAAGKSQVFYQSSGLLEGYSGVNQIQMRDRHSGETLATIEAQTRPAVSLSHQGSVIFSSANDHIFAFDLKTLQPIPQQATIPDLKRLAISGNTLALQTTDALLALNVTASSAPSQPVIISRKVSDFHLAGDAILFASGREIIRLEMPQGTQTKLYSALSEIRRFAVLDEKAERLALLLQDGTLWLPQQDKTISPGTTRGTQIIAEQNGGFYLSALSDPDGLWNNAIPLIRKFDGDGKRLLDLEPDWSTLSALAIDRSGRLWGGSEAGELLVWDPLSGRRLYKTAAHLDRINDLHLMDDGRLVSGADDGTIHLWQTEIPSFSFDHPQFIGAAMLGLFENDIKKRHPQRLATLVMDKQGGYLLAGSDGYYSASPGALTRTSFTENDRVLDFSRFDLWLNRPDILARRIGHSSEPQVKLLEQMVSFRRSRHADLPATLPSLEDAPQLTVSLPDAASSTSDLELPWQASAVGDAKLLRLTIDVNGVPLNGREGIKIEEQQHSGRLKVPLSQGQNQIRITVSDSNGLRSSPTHLVVNRVGEKSQPALYLLAIGVSDYSNDALDLNYADKDARDIAAYYEQHGGSFSAVHVKTLLNASATRSNIMQAKQFLQQAKSDDRVIIFFAGHGFLDDDERYYFGTADIEPAAPQLQGLSYSELNTLIDGLASRYKLLLLDTCHSGEVAPLAGQSVAALSPEVSARGFNIKRRAKPPAFEFSLEALQGRFADLREATGAIVLSAAGGREYALEKSEWGNGVFTASVLKGLRDSAADSNEDGKVAISELRTFVYKEVQRLTNGEQKPTTRELNLTLDFAVN